MIDGQSVLLSGTHLGPMAMCYYCPFRDCYGAPSLTSSRPVCPGVRPPSGPVTNFSFSLKFSLDSCGLVILWRSLWREDGSVFTLAAGPRQRSPSRIWDPRDSRPYFIFPLPQPWEPCPVFISPRDRVVQLYPRALGSLFVAPYDSLGYGGGILARLHTTTA
jgi:hypothetical protein